MQSAVAVCSHFLKIKEIKNINVLVRIINGPEGRPVNLKSKTPTQEATTPTKVEIKLYCVKFWLKFRAEAGGIDTNAAVNKPPTI